MEARLGALPIKSKEALKQQEVEEQERDAREAAALQIAAREEAFAAVRNFAESMQELAIAGGEQRLELLLKVQQHRVAVAPLDPVLLA